MRFTRQWSLIVLAVFLILWGLTMITSVPVPGIVLGILALAAGVLILIDR